MCLKNFLHKQQSQSALRRDSVTVSLKVCRLQTIIFLIVLELSLQDNKCLLIAMSKFFELTSKDWGMCVDFVLSMYILNMFFLGNELEGLIGLLYVCCRGCCFMDLCLAGRS